MGFSLGNIIGGLNPLNAALSVGGLLLSQDQNRKAARDQNNATRLQQDAYAKSQKAADDFLKQIQQSDANGLWNPTQTLNQLRQENQQNLGIALGNQGGLARTLGYAPGDSEVINALGATSNKYALDYNRQANDITQSMNANRLNAYRDAYGMQSGAANSGYSMGQGLYGQAQQRTSDPSSLIAALQPFLKVGSPSQTTSKTATLLKRNAGYLIPRNF